MAVSFIYNGVMTKSLSNPENETITPDDRQQLLEVIGGVVVQDFGCIADGEKVAWTLQFDTSSWATIKTYWTSRTLVTVVDAAGNSFTARIVVKSYSYVPMFETKAVQVTLELWRC